ncbi:hypothetical protein ABWL39_08715 [Chitinivorax sp. PXF-14]|uniref:hypothetical protein n=1 Tax=Chitinivorax sp. PXF-14 TaxID=3230488 RepID=UPI0034651BAF
MTMPERDDSELQLAILAYLQAHPGAGDTIDGILGWWLGVTDGEQRSRVEASLDALAEAGAVTRHRLPDGKVIYSRQRNVRNR